MNSTQENLFIVLHTMGNHWNYAKRYPEEFDYFQPSGTTAPISPPTARKRERILNSYDNSIRYADYIIDRVINTINKLDAVSSVAFLSDHGEDLFDAHPAKPDFHLDTSPTTLRVPLFIWTSAQYRQAYPEKQASLLENRTKKVGTENTFYTLLDLANVGISEDRPSKSLASSSFKESKQKYLGKRVRKGFLFSHLR